MTGKIKNARWEHFEHQADIGIRGLGDTIEQALEQAALAVTAVITDPETVKPEQEIEITCDAPDHEALLVEWLNHLLCEMDTRKMLFSRFEVTVTGNRLTAVAWGQPVDITKHAPAVEVKAATYSALGVKQNKDGTWLAQCVVDV
jgi:tRNA nucleotidyltransferase (CCA-adding enzyme)